MYIYIYLYIDVRGEPNGSKYTKTKNHLSNIFGLSIFFVEEPPQYLLQGGRKLSLIIYIYIYIYQNINIRGCVSAKRLRIWRNAEIGVQYFGLSIFFVTDLLLYLLQGGRKTAFVENIYIRSRLRETHELIFCISYLFCKKKPPPYLQQGGRKTSSKTPNKKKKVKKNT